MGVESEICYTNLPSIEDIAMKRRGFLKLLGGIAAMPFVGKAAAIGGGSSNISEADKVIIDMVSYGTGASQGGKHVPIEARMTATELERAINPPITTSGAYLNGQRIPFSDCEKHGTLVSPSYMQPGDLLEIKLPIDGDLAFEKYTDHKHRARLRGIPSSTETI